VQVRQQSGTVFPAAEAEIVPQIGVLYRAFDQNEKLVRTVMESNLGARVRARGAEEGRASFDQSLQEVTQGRTPRATPASEGRVFTRSIPARSGRCCDRMYAVPQSIAPLNPIKFTHKFPRRGMFLIGRSMKHRQWIDCLL
jgi:hypothetical protein